MTFGFTEMNSGFKLLPVLIGLFAVNQIFRDIINIEQKGEAIALGRKSVFVRLADFGKHWVNLIRSAVVGTWIGILPGIGANIGSVTAYSMAKSTSKTPEKFGTGHESGVVAAEAANNATVGGALIPLVAMGIPGSVVDAILLGALILHGLQPGPRLFTENPEMVYTIMGACVIGNIIMALVMLGSMRHLARLVKVPRVYLLPVILMFCVVGAYALSNRMFDVWVMLGFGVLGFVLEAFRIPLAPLMIGFVLGPIAEKNLSQGLLLEGSLLPLVTRPISAVFVVISVLLLIVPVFIGKRRARQEEERGEG